MRVVRPRGREEVATVVARTADSDTVRVGDKVVVSERRTGSRPELQPREPFTATVLRAGRLVELTGRAP